MGFGYLFFGAFLAANFLAYPELTMLPAVLLMLMGMLTLGNFNRPLRQARLLLFPAVLVSLVCFVFAAIELFGFLPAESYETASYIFSLALELLMAAFTLRLLSGIALLGEETELPKIVFRAKRNAILIAVSYGLSILLSLPIEAEWFTLAANHTYAPLILFRLIAMLLNALLIYSCYMYICMPEDLEMPRRKTGIRFLDGLFEKMDRREEEQAARTKEELAKLYHEREAEYRSREAERAKNSKKRKKK